MPTDYTNIDRPYGELLERDDALSVPVGDETQATDVQGGGTSSQQDSGNSGGGGTGSVESQTVTSGASMGDVWIANKIRSDNWKPKTSGFYIDGATGYAEFSNIVVIGPITATSGTVGGWSITSSELYSGNVHINSANEQILMGSATNPTTGTGIFMGLDSSVYQFRAGNPAGAYMLWNGTSLTVNGPIIYTPLISSALAAGSILNIQGWKFDGAFSVTDADTVAWGTGTLSFADGQSFSISSGNTGNMTAKTYIYFDKDASQTVLQTTTTASNTVGANKVLIATAEDGTGEATFFVMNDDQKNIDAASIVANSITANELSTSITYAGTIVVDTSGNIRSGQTAYDTGTGWWLGNDSGTPKFSLGSTSTGNKMSWDGSTLSVVGKITNLVTKNYTCFENSGRFNTGTSSATLAFNTSGLQVTTTSSPTSYGWATWFLSQYMFRGKPTFHCRIELNSTTNSKGEIFVGIGTPTVATTGHTFTSIVHAGFFIDLDPAGVGAATIYKVCGNGSNESSTAVQTIYPGGVSGYTLDLAFVHEGSTITYYIRDDGEDNYSSLGTLTTYVPSSSAIANEAQFSTICNDVSGSGGGWSMIFISSSYES